MRVLFIPQITALEVAAESDKYDLDCILRALRAIEPTFAYWWLRQDDARRVAEKPGEMALFRELSIGFYAQMAAVDLHGLVDLFSWQQGIYPIDVVFTSRAGVAPLLSMALADVGGQYAVPVVITEPRVYGPGERGHNEVHPMQLALRAAGYATCFGIYWSAWERQMALEAAALYCAPAVVKAAEERSFVVDALVDADELGPSTWRKAGPKRLLWAGRINQNKRWEEVIEAYARVLQSRSDGVEVWVHAGTGAFGKLAPAQHRWHVTSERLSREAYLDLLRSSHVAAYLSHDEGANVTTQEMLAAGIVLALPKRPWVERLFYPLTYPFTVSRADELPGLLDWLLDHYEEALAALSPVRELIARERSWPAFLAKFRRLYEALWRVRRPGAFRVFREMAYAEFRRRRRHRNGPVAVPFSSLRQQLTSSSGWPELTEARGAYACYQAIRDLDDMTAPDPLLREPSEAEVA